MEKNEGDVINGGISSITRELHICYNACKCKWAPTAPDPSLRSLVAQKCLFPSNSDKRDGWVTFPCFPFQCPHHSHWPYIITHSLQCVNTPGVPFNWPQRPEHTNPGNDKIVKPYQHVYIQLGLCGHLRRFSQVHSETGDKAMLSLLPWMVALELVQILLF